MDAHWGLWLGQALRALGALGQLCALGGKDGQAVLQM